ncbi:hypothetical protein Fmac_014686 [Flemingia macrophylla]|uniref:Uncharacterized protein n=1 Tax=Flemingia macrophylla TaxID=520843 RepID=A0ABD1MCF5_9FABA
MRGSSSLSSNEFGDNDPILVSNPTNALVIDDDFSTVITKPNDNSNEFVASSLGCWQNYGSNPITPSSLPSRPSPHQQHGEGNVEQDRLWEKLLARRPGGPSHQLSRGGGLGGAESQSKCGAWAVTVK